MAVGRILEFTSLFGLADGTVRTALSRMVAAGDLVNHDGSYHLGDRLLERQAQQDASRRAPAPEWDRAWWTVAVATDRRTMTERRTFRAQASGARLGELRPDLWLRPANIELAIDPATDLVGSLVVRGPLVAGDEVELVAQLWDLDDLRTRAESHLAALDAASDRLDDGDDRALADAFIGLAAAQQFLRVEPQLPAELSPDDSGARLRRRYADVVERFQSQLGRFFATQRSTGLSTDARSAGGGSRQSGDRGDPSTRADRRTSDGRRRRS
jgi:phenylacetic acid degradation operon negative regulatory protein